MQNGSSLSVESIDRAYFVDHVDESGYVDRAHGTSVPTDATAGFAVGCTFRKTNGTIGSTLYVNEGSVTSCDFNVVESASSNITGVTAGNGLTGGGTSGTVSLAVGLTIYNDTGGTLTKGTLVRVKSYTSTSGITVEKSDADANIIATHVVIADITNATSGEIQPIATLTGLATNGQAIGDPVYLSTTAGAFTFTAPTTANAIIQQVGTVKVVHASTGEIAFFPGTAQITRRKLSAEAVTASADGTGTGVIAESADFVTVTSSGATQAVTLPSGAVGNVGKILRIWVGANGFELITPASSNATINNVDSDGTNQADIGANTLSTLVLVATDTWLLMNQSNLGAVNTAIIPDND